MKEGVEAFWRNQYAAAFLRKDPQAYVDSFALPCLIRAENLGRRVFTDRPALRDYCASLISKAEQTCWDSSTIDKFEIEMLDAEVATVKVVASRFDADGRRISRLYGNYTVNQEMGAWKMVSIFGGFLPE